MVLIKGKEYITVAERINMLHKESNNVESDKLPNRNDNNLFVLRRTYKVDRTNSNIIGGDDNSAFHI